MRKTGDYPVESGKLKSMENEHINQVEIWVTLVGRSKPNLLPVTGVSSGFYFIKMGKGAE